MKGRKIAKVKDYYIIIGLCEGSRCVWLEQKPR